MKKGWLTLLVVLLVLAGAGLYLFRVSEDTVVANRMLDFDKIEPGTEMEWSSKKDVRVFEHAVRFARKNPGVVDIAAPPYSFQLNGDTYWLYTLPEYDIVQFINSKHSGTLYTVRKYWADPLKELLREADSVGFGTPSRGSKAYPGYEEAE